MTVQLALVEQHLATYRQAVLGRAVDDEAVVAAAKVVVAARTTEQGPRAQMSFLDAVKEGGDAVFDGVFPSKGRVGVALDWLMWVVIGALVALGWRALERRSSAQEAGPVTLELKTKAESVEKAAQEAALRIAALQNMREPGAMPGSARPSPVSDLAELVTPASGWPKILVATIKVVTNAPSGYLAEVDLAEPSGDQRQWTVLVRLRENRTGVQVALKTLRATDALSGCSAAGYWIAATIIGRSTRLPSWIRWSGDTSEALARWSGAGQEPDLDTLVDVVATAPSSGIMLHKLGFTYDLHGRHVDALGAYARAVLVHPTYRTAIYRMAACMSIFAWQPELWHRAPLSQQQRVAGEVSRACKRIGVPWSLPDSPRDASNISDQLWVDGGLAVYKALTARVYLPVIQSFLRRSERDDLLSGGNVVRLARRGKWIVNAAKLVLLVKNNSMQSELSPLRDSVEKQARRATSFWQVNYNLACYYSRHHGRERPQLDDLTNALSHLEQARGREGGHQMGRDWLEVDPDLANLRHLPRFRSLLEQLPSPKTRRP